MLVTGCVPVCVSSSVRLVARRRPPRGGGHRSVDCVCPALQVATVPGTYAQFILLLKVHVHTSRYSYRFSVMKDWRLLCNVQHMGLVGLVIGLLGVCVYLETGSRSPSNWPSGNETLKALHHV